MVDEMIKCSDKKISDAAIENKAAAEKARAARATLALVRPAMEAHRAMLGPMGAAKKKNRIIYDAKLRPNLDGKVVRREGDKNTGDKEVDEAYRFTGYVHDFYKKFFGRNSIDDQGLLLKSSVRYREHQSSPYNNAFWWNNQMAYGDGDGTVFKRFTSSLDVIAHELTHGVVEYTANLEYKDESGALNESYADVFGSLVKQWRKKQTASKADWLIGDDLIFKTATRTALRSLKAPGTAYSKDPFLGSDPQPADVKHQFKGSQDDGGVHINSGIPNRVFYLVAVGIGGNAWEKAGRIWYNSLAHLTPTSNFQDCAVATEFVATKLYGSGSKEVNAVVKAWKAVGVT
jgi:Zn-dependent metalloprotease